MTQHKPQKSEKASSASEAPKKSSLEQKVEKTSAGRDDVTRRLTSDLITPTRTVDKLVVDACKFAGITPPKPKEPLAPFVYKLQKQVCRFNIVDNRNGCDGMLGPITLAALIKAIPKLKVYSKEARTAKLKKKRQQFVKSAGLPPIPTPLPLSTPSKKSPTKKEAAPESNEGAITPEKTALIGDSLTVQFGKYFYKGTSKYKENLNKNYKGGRRIDTMRKKLEKNCPMADAYVLGAAANNIVGHSVDRIEGEFIKILAILKNKNPNARIVLLTLHGDNTKYWHRAPKRIIKKMLDLNRRLRVLAAANPKITLIDIRHKIRQAEAEGHRMLASDKLHYNRRGSKAVAGLIKDELQNGEHGVLTDYA